MYHQVLGYRGTMVSSEFKFNSATVSQRVKRCFINAYFCYVDIRQRWIRRDVAFNKAFWTDNKWRSYLFKNSCSFWIFVPIIHNDAGRLNLRCKIASAGNIAMGGLCGDAHYERKCRATTQSDVPPSTQNKGLKSKLQIKLMVAKRWSNETSLTCSNK